MDDGRLLRGGVELARRREPAARLEGLERHHEVLAHAPVDGPEVRPHLPQPGLRAPRGVHRVEVAEVELEALARLDQQQRSAPRLRGDGHPHGALPVGGAPGLHPVDGEHVACVLVIR